jgi:muramidase (phage lysozyme)
VTSTATGSSAGAAGVPACASESGTNYSTDASNTNPSSGATGRYQILPSTAAAYGCSLATPAGQDACAATIYRNQGAGAWVGCGG